MTRLDTTIRTLGRLLAASGLTALLLLGACSSSDGPTDPGQPDPPGVEGNWILEHGQLTDMRLYALWAAGPNDVWGVSGEGYIAHFDGDGWTLSDPWEREPRDLRDIWGAAADDIWAVGDGATLMHYDGERWGLASGDLEGSFHGVWGSASDDVWAVGEGGVIYHYDGVAWEYDSSWGWTFYDVIGTGADDVFAIGGSGRVYRYAGAGWTEMSTPTSDRLVGACVDDEGRVYAVGDNGAVIRWNGASWSALDTGASGDLQGVTSVGDRVYAVGDNGVILLYDGEGWGFMTSGVSGNLWDVLAVSDTFLLTCGEEGSVLVGDGATWQRFFTEDNSTFYAVMLLDDGDGWAGDEEGRIWRRGAAGWDMVDELGFVIRGIWGPAADDLWAVGDGGAIRHWDGADWSSHDSSTGQGLQGIHGIAATGEAWAVGNNGTVIRYDPGADEWTTVDSGTTYTLYDCVVQSDGTVFVGGVQGTVRRWDPAEEAWFPETTGWEFDLTGMHGLADGTLVACDYVSHVYWRDSAGGWRTEWVSGETTFNDIWATSANSVWALEYGGRVQYYDGTTWTTVADVARYDLYAIDGNAGGEILAAGSIGRILHYTP